MGEIVTVHVSGPVVGLSSSIGECRGNGRTSVCMNNSSRVQRLKCSVHGSCGRGGRLVGGVM